jgi:glucokinase
MGENQGLNGLNGGAGSCSPPATSHLPHTVLAIDIGGTHFRIALFDLQGRHLVTSEGDTLRSGGRQWMLDEILRRTSALLGQEGLTAAACGISFGGPVDFRHQKVTSVHSPGWEDFSFARWVDANLHLPCLIDNDANAGALGEFRFGAGRGTESMVYVTLSTGIGAGVVLNGKIHRGKDGLAGELGHIPISEVGNTCSCGAVGCLESFSSGSAIAERGREWRRLRGDSLAALGDSSRSRSEGITAREIAQAAAQGDPADLEIIRAAARSLARGLLTVIRILNPDRIILGGGLIQAGAVLLDPLRGSLTKLASPTIGYSTEIVTAGLGAYSPLYGAAAMALDLAGQ